MANDKQKNGRKPLIDAERLSSLLTKLEAFRNAESLSTGEFEFLLHTNLGILKEMHKKNMDIAQCIEELKAKNESARSGVS